MASYSEVTSEVTRKSDEFSMRLTLDEARIPAAQDEIRWVLKCIKQCGQSLDLYPLIRTIARRLETLPSKSLGSCNGK